MSRIDEIKAIKKRVHEERLKSGLCSTWAELTYDEAFRIENLLDRHLYLEKCAELYEAYDGSKLDKADKYIEKLEAENKRLQEERDAAVNAIREICNHCGFNNKPCTENGCFAYEWRGIENGGKDV
jgi:hypothetical protein